MKQNDKDFFITEWQGDEIFIEEILGENIIAQYREKGTEKWIDRSISNNKLQIEKLNPNKTYQLRVFNVNSLRIVDIFKEFDLI